MCILLKRVGHKVTLANSIAAALSASECSTFDLVISDIGLPDGSGIDLMRRIRARHAMPAIALSGFGMEADIARSREAGFSEHLTKPVDLDRLEILIRGFAENAPA